MAILLMIVAGCASDRGNLAGRHGKNGGPERVERLGAITMSELPAARQCSTRQVSWCVDRGSSLQCRCVFLRTAEDRIRRMARELRQQSMHH